MPLTHDHGVEDLCLKVKVGVRPAKSGGFWLKEMGMGYWCDTPLASYECVLCDTCVRMSQYQYVRVDVLYLQ